MSLASANSMVWNCKRSLDTLLDEIENMKPSDGQKDKITLLIMLGINTVETFVNIYFRVLVEQEEYKNHREFIIEDLSADNGQKPRGLKYKLNHWPPKILGKSVNWSSGIGLEFEKLRLQRNKLTHFTSSHETLALPGVTFYGLVDTSVFTELNLETAVNAHRTVIEFIRYLFSLTKIKEENIQHAMHSWLGLVPRFNRSTGVYE